MINVYFAKEIAEQIKKEPVPETLVAYADLVDTEKKLSEAKDLLKRTLGFINPTSYLASKIEELLSEK